MIDAVPITAISVLLFLIAVPFAAITYFPFSPIAILLRTVFVSIPTSVFLPLHPPSLNSLTAALILTMSHASKASSPLELQPLLHWTSADNARQAKRKGAVTKEVNHGLWIAEHPLHIHPRYHSNLVIVFYIHGGGYCLGSAKMNAHLHYDLIHRFNQRERATGSDTRLVVFSAEYPLAPQSRFPSQLLSILQAYHYVLWFASASPSRRIFVSGDSAGGHAAILLLHYLHQTLLGQPTSLQTLFGTDDVRDRDDLASEDHAAPVQWQMPSGVILLSPWIDPHLDTLVHHDVTTDATFFDYISIQGSRTFSRHAFGEHKEWASLVPEPNHASAYKGSRDVWKWVTSAVSPAANGYAEPAPRVLLAYGGAEHLRVALDRLVDVLRERMGSHGNRLCVVRAPGMPHVFMNLPIGSMKGPAEEVHSSIVEFLRGS